MGSNDWLVSGRRSLIEGTGLSMGGFSFIVKGLNGSDHEACHVRNDSSSNARFKVLHKHDR